MAYDDYGMGNNLPASPPNPANASAGTGTDPYSFSYATWWNNEGQHLYWNLKEGLFRTADGRALTPQEYFSEFIWPSPAKRKAFDASYKAYTKSYLENMLYRDLTNPSDPNDPAVKQVTSHAQGVASTAARNAGLAGPVSTANVTSASAGALAGLEAQRKANAMKFLEILKNEDLNQQQLDLQKEQFQYDKDMMPLKVAGQVVGLGARVGTSFIGTPAGLTGSSSQGLDSAPPANPQLATGPGSESVRGPQELASRYTPTRPIPGGGGRGY